MKKTKKVLLTLCLVALMTFNFVPFMITPVQAADDVVYNANTWDIFKNRTKKDIADEYNKALSSGSTYKDNDRSTWYKVEASASNPYEPGELTTDTHKAMTAMTNYYRWLVGVNPVTESSHSEAMQAEALIRNLQFGHVVTIPKPDDMDESLWNIGSKLTHNILAMGYSPRDAIVGWLDEGYCLDVDKCTYKGFDSVGFNTIGHRMALISQKHKSLTYGYVGKVAIGKIGYGGNNTLPYVAYPAPGYMPYNELPANTSAWNIELDNSIVTYDSLSNVTVTVTNKKDNSSYTCTKANGNLSTYSGALVFKQPSPTNRGYYSVGDTFEVEVTGLKDVQTGKSAKIVYITEFFDVTNVQTPVVTSITVTSPTKNTYMVGENMDVTGGKVNITYSDGTTSSVSLTNSMLSGFSSAKKGISTVTVTYEGKKATFDTLVVETPKEMDAIEGNTLSMITLPTDSNGTYAWKDAGTTTVGSVGKNNFEVVYTPNDTKYSSITMDVVINVTADLGYTVPTDLTATYGDTLSSVTLPAGFAWKKTDALVGNAGKQVFLATYTKDGQVADNIKITVVVNKKVADAIKVPVLSDMEYDANKKLSDIKLPEGWSWENPELVPTVDNKGYRATYQPKDTDNYDYSNQNLSPVLTITVTKATPSYVLPSNLVAHWGDRLEDVELPEGFRFQETGLVGELGQKTFKLVYTPQDTVNYSTISDIEVTVTVEKAIASVETPAVITIDGMTGKTLSDVELPKGWSWKTPDIKIEKSGYYTAIYIPEDIDHYQVQTTEVYIGVVEEIDDTPNTGDNSMTNIYLIVCMISFCGMLALAFLSKKVEE